MVYISKQRIALTVFVFSLSFFSSSYAQYDLKITNSSNVFWVFLIDGVGDNKYIMPGETKYFKIYNNVVVVHRNLDGSVEKTTNIQIPWHGELLFVTDPNNNKGGLYDFQPRSDYYANNNSYQQEYEEDDGIGLEMIMYIGIIIVGLVALLQ